jgi:hypothetical protein
MKRNVRRLRVRKAKVKVPAYELVTRDTEQGNGMYDLLGKVREFPEHESLGEARIALAFCSTWKYDRDGRIVLGQCRKQTALTKEFMSFDFIILINKVWWNDPNTDDLQREVLVFHELCHAAPNYDPISGEQKRDARDRLEWRIRKHDLEEFRSVLARYGLWKSDLQAGFRALLSRALADVYVPCEVCRDTTNPGFVTRVMSKNGTDYTALVRCACFDVWATRREEAIRVAS